jgi:hypothetical protein
VGGSQNGVGEGVGWEVEVNCGGWSGGSEDWVVGT